MLILFCFTQAVSAVAADCEIPRVDFRLAAADEVTDEPRRTGAHRPAKRAVAGIEKEAGDLCRADDRRAIRRHWAQTRPEGGLGNIAAGEEIGNRMFQRAAAGQAEIVGIA